jgi:Uma2 family endonuclease
MKSVGQVPNLSYLLILHVPDRLRTCPTDFKKRNDEMAVEERYITRPGWVAAMPGEPIWQLSVGQYRQMVRNGILTDDDPVELLEGLLIPKMPKNPPHRLANELARDALARLVPAGWHINMQEPITTADSEPEPDLAIVRGERRQYGDRHPGAAEIAVVIEVADATLLRDRKLKKRLYARAGIPVYWIINLPENQIEIYTLPSSGAEEPDYQWRQDYSSIDEAPLVIDGQEVGRLAALEVLP